MENTELSQYIDEINKGNDNYSSTPLYDYVKEMPTAYDVDKVIERLEEYSKDVSRGYKGADRNYHRHYKAVNTNKAIEIVKRGGVDE